MLRYHTNGLSIRVALGVITHSSIEVCLQSWSSIHVLSQYMNLVEEQCSSKLPPVIYYTHIPFLETMSNSTPNNFVAHQANVVGVVGPSNSTSMPKHMRLDEWPLPYPLSVLLQCIFTGLCILATGHTTLEHFLNIAIEDGEMWIREKMIITTRLNQNNFIVSYRQHYFDVFIVMIRADCLSLP